MPSAARTATVGWRQARVRRSGLTLVELVVAMVIMTIVMAGLTSAILIASHALPDSADPLAHIAEVSAAMEQISTEIGCAKYIAERSAHTITFTVADRNGDGVPERIHYAWSGTVGDPLTRQYNGGAGINVIEDVQAFALAYDLESVTEEYPGPDIESAETRLASYTATNDSEDFDIEQEKWIGQYFEPALPEDATAWRVTRVQFQAKCHGPKSELTWVQLRLPDANNEPSDPPPLEKVQMPESILTDGYLWKEFSFSNVSGLSPDEGLCLVLQHFGASNKSATIQYENVGGSGRLETTDGGTSWSFDDDKSMYYCIYGTYMSPGPPQTASRQYVTGVRVAIQAGDQTSARLDTAVRMLNTPEVLSAAWELDFDTDPTVQDMNADGLGDWVCRDGAPFNPGTLSGGIWYAGTTLDTYPDNDFTELITAEVRFRNTSIGGNGAVFWINADWSGGKFAALFAFLQLQPDGTQTLTVYHKIDNSTSVPLVTLPGLPAGFVTLRLLIDPDLDTVNVRVNRQDQGTYYYNSFAQGDSDRFATVLPWGSAAEFDSVSVRVGGND
ncbi:MAG: prepilin-type N-terminal cleavage/methylation domain-containing protein [Phycisphaerae bacterium]|nr:prepilin-type N-terminal cleavage/methylation domain-containing protein [Phycisphaerae bacterium]